MYRSVCGAFLATITLLVLSLLL
ncbi:putative cross-wall-targeting lipoprotein signal domain-containing proteiin [Sphingobacterium sp. WOUb80]